MAPSTSHRRMDVASRHLLAHKLMMAPASANLPLSRVDEVFSKFLAAGSAPGVAYGVLLDGKLIHTGGCGTLHVGEEHLPRSDSIFRIASMTKSFIAATVLLLRDEGLLQLDDAVTRWIPELKGQPLPSGDSRPPTLRQLLSMNAGFPEDDAWADRLESLTDEEYSQLISEPKDFSRAPGVAFEYANFGYSLLGRVIQNVTGRPFREVVSERIIAPLGLNNTRWSDVGVDPSQLATGYVRVDGVWVAQPVQAPGAFSAIGGLYSTVADLSVWVAGFLDAWPARDDTTDAHPLSRASRREMQQVVTAMPLQLGSSQGLLRARAVGYCFGLISTEDVITGRTLDHSGGYPGFGSNMIWHPVCRVGVIALANGRYAGPSRATSVALAELVAALPRLLKAEPRPQVAAIRREVDAAIVAGDFARLAPLLSSNLDLDETLERRAAAMAGLRAVHGTLEPEPRLIVMSPMHVAWWLVGERGRVGVHLMLSPDSKNKIQQLDITSVRPATPALEAAAAAAREAAQKELSELLLPLRSTSWVSCDGERTGTLLLEGAHIDVQLRIDLGKTDAVVRPLPVVRAPLPA